jgi:hypothetical protein
MRFMLAALLVGHGVAHLVGFVVPWKLMTRPEMPYRTTILGGMMNVGDAGVRLIGILWLAIAVAFVVVAGGVVAGWSMRMAVFALLALSSAFCVIGWPEARFGLIVNAALLVALLALPELAGR